MPVQQESQSGNAAVPEREPLIQAAFRRQQEKRLLSLMMQPVSTPEALKQLAAEQGKDLMDGPVQILSVEPDSRASPFTEEKTELLHFQVKAMAEELSGREASVLSACRGSVCYCIFVLRKGSFLTHGQIREMTESMLQTPAEQPGIQAAACLSAQYDSLEQIHSAWREVEWLRRFQRFSVAGAQPVCSGTGADKTGQDTTQMLRELQQKLQAGSLEEAEQTVLQILNIYEYGGGLRTDDYDLQIEQLLGPVLTCLKENTRQGTLPVDQYRQFYRELRQADSMEELRCVLHAVLKTLKTKNAGSADKPAWMTGLMEQIRTGFRNPQMSVNYLADRTGITSVHLSRVFRRIYGLGVMEYIHQLRVEEAKHLIENGASVKSAMGMVGYSNQLTMTRAFKRLEGCTPGACGASGTCADRRVSGEKQNDGK